MRCRLAAAAHYHATYGVNPTFAPTVLHGWDALDEDVRDRLDEATRKCVVGLGGGAEAVARAYGWVWAAAEGWQIDVCRRFAKAARELGGT